MKALTISQPYASLIASGEKFIENRTWERSYRGPLAIHAGLGSKYLSKTELSKYPTGCVVALARLVACVRLSTILSNADIASNKRKSIVPGTTKNWSELGRHKHAEGPWCWVLEDVVKLDPPIACRGAQGLCQIPESVIPDAVLKDWIDAQ